MPEARMEQEDEYKFPADVPLQAKLEKVEEQRIPYTIKRGDRQGQTDYFYKWAWHFRITEGQYENLVAFADTDAKLTTHPENKVRQFAEVLLGRQFDIGEGLNTDELLGLPCQIVCAHEKREANGKTYYKCPVVDLFPADAIGGGGGDPWATQGEPPF